VRGCHPCFANHPPPMYLAHRVEAAHHVLPAWQGFYIRNVVYATKWCVRKKNIKNCRRITMKKKMKIVLVISTIFVMILISFALLYIFIISNPYETLGNEQDVKFKTYKKNSFTNESRGIYINNSSQFKFEFYIVHNSYVYSGNSVYEIENIKMYELNGDYSIICHVHFSFTDAPEFEKITNITTNETKIISFTPRLYVYTEDDLPSNTFKIIVYYQEVGFRYQHSEEKIEKQVTLE
jgi:hypothetical protein